jgi:ferredoxin
MGFVTVRGMRVKLSQKWVPSVRRDRCQACGLCGSICPNGCLDLLDGAGAVVRAEACTSEEQCVSACPEGAIRMMWARAEGDRSIGRWRGNGPPPVRSRQLGTVARSR